MHSHTTSPPSAGPGAAPVPTELDRLKRRVDELAQEVLQTRDAALGAEAELGVVRARVGELEHQVHVRDVEIAELRAALDARSATGDVSAALTSGLATGDRLARGLARRARASRA
ncbi:MAG: hypothetical protein AAGA93_04120 [Actinomycetota bacterium]